jgi:hypothetical protein
VAEYRYLAHDLRTNTALGELPLSGVQYGEQLNGAGTFQATMSLIGNAANLLAWTQPERTAIYIERDGAIVGGSIVWTRQRRFNSAVTLGGAGWWSFFRRQHRRTRYSVTGTDQLVIARALVQDAEAVPGADIGVTVGAELSGVLRDRTYEAYELKQVAEAVEQLANVNDGFDFAIDTTATRGKVLTLSYPRRGRIAGTTGIVFEAGKNILDYEVAEDGTRSARTYTALGAGDGNDMLLATNTRTDLIDLGFPLTSETGAFKDVVIQSTLDAHALAGVNARAITPTFWRVTVDPDDIDGGIGTFITGDDVLLRIPDDDNFARQADGSPGYERFHRVIDWTLSIPDAGKDTLTVTLGEIS